MLIMKGCGNGYVALYILIVGEGECILSVGAFYGWLDWIKYLVNTVGLKLNGND